MDQGPLVSEEIDAAADLIRVFDKIWPVKVAFWLKASDEDQRYLYIASDSIKDTNLGAAYRDVVRMVRHKPSPYLDVFRIKVIAGTNPLASAAADVIHRYPAPLATRIGGGKFGGLTVDDGYIYPPSVASAVP